jgi:hypothetical protein
MARVTVYPLKAARSPKYVPITGQRSARARLTRCRTRLRAFCRYVMAHPRPSMDAIRAEAQRHLTFLDRQ